MPQNPRVLCVVDSLDVGGVREVVLSQLAALRPERFDLGLLTLANDLEKADGLIPPHVSQHAAQYRTDYGYRLLDYLADGFLLRGPRKFGREALRAIEDFDPTILHFHTNPRDLGLGILATRPKQRSLVYTDHLVRIRSTDYPGYSRYLLRSAYRRLYRHFHTISVGRTVFESNRASGFLDFSRKHVVLENQVDLHDFQPPSQPREDTPVEIICVGRINATKGIDTLLRAFGQLEVQESVRLVLVGPDAMAGAMQRLAEECVRPPLEVRFLGERTDVPYLLQRASIGVLPSRREGLPLALLEMMASGLPVVVTDIPEIASLVTDGADASVVRVDDTDSLAGALEALVRRPELRSRLGQAARRSVEQRAEIDPVQELGKFYDRLARPD